MFVNLSPPEGDRVTRLADPRPCGAPSSFQQALSELLAALRRNGKPLVRLRAHVLRQGAAEQPALSVRVLSDGG